MHGSKGVNSLLTRWRLRPDASPLPLIEVEPHLTFQPPSHPMRKDQELVDHPGAIQEKPAPAGYRSSTKTLAIESIEPGLIYKGE